MDSETFKEPSSIKLAKAETMQLMGKNSKYKTRSEINLCFLSKISCYSSWLQGLYRGETYIQRHMFF